jgi:hypothetical protein
MARRDAMKAQICQCCHQFLELQEEDMQPYLQTFVTTVWGILVSCTSRSSQDNLAMAAVTFLTAVCRSTHYQLFASGDTIKKVRSLCGREGRCARNLPSSTLYVIG